MMDGSYYGVEQIFLAQNKEKDNDIINFYTISLFVNVSCACNLSLHCNTFILKSPFVLSNVFVLCTFISKQWISF